MACLLAASVLVTLWDSPGVAQVEEGAAVHFGSDIQPILSDKCYFCHGPDEENRAADLRLDLAEAARDALDSGELVRRIRSNDEYERMPPPETNLSLTEEERQLIEQWVADGAAYETHWSFKPLAQATAVPYDPADHWSRGEVDRFVWARARQAGWTPNEEAEPRRWLRRVTLDLTGLPPTLEEIERFLADLAEDKESERVYEQVVDRLLASPAYGEHFAVSWLDAARYADSYGYQSDQLNTQWPYRDWVIQALNDNLPYDTFLRWQLAGDLIDEPTRNTRLATAFNRLHRLNNEGGAVFEEWRLENVADRVHTFGTAVLGLTLECSRCHDHKYDPISARDYYSLSAFFNSIDESGVYDQSAKAPAPSILLPTDEQSKRLDEARTALAGAEAAYAAEVEAARGRFAAWLSEHAGGPLDSPDLVRALDLDAKWSRDLSDLYKPVTGDRNKTAPYDPVATGDNPLPRLAAKKRAEPVARRGVQLDGDRGLMLGGVELIDRWTPFSLLLNLRETKRSRAPAVVAQRSFGQLAYNGWDLRVVDGRLESRMYRDWPGNAIGVRSDEPIPAGEWVQIAATYDGSSRAQGLRLYVNGRPLATKVLRDRIVKRAGIEVMHGGELIIGQRFRDQGYDGAVIDDVGFYRRDLTEAELRQAATDEASSPDFDYYASALDERARAARQKLTEARQTLALAEEAIHEVPIMEELPEPRETHVLARGAYDAPTGPDTRVERDVFENLGPPLPNGARRDRLGLAEWATDGDHPLTARVAVNRLWASVFGAGLVRTPENFGLQGEAPTHPSLLDWLARDFVEGGWDVKRLCKQLVLSSTYRQDSRASPGLVEQDPENRLLARGPAYRLTGEQIRDLALATSGLLNRERGGPSVSPYQPGDDLWTESNSMSPAYRQSVGVDLYRRSLYSVWKRTAPLPNMMAFDSQSREVCTVKRPRTNTPLQALVLLNDPQFVEAARVLASAALAQHDEVAEQIHWVFETLTGRPPDTREQAALVQLATAELTHYAADPNAAEALLAIGESAAPTGLPKERLATMTVICQAVMNLDATVWKR